MSKFLALIERYAEESICCIALSVISVCVFLQVIMRYVFNSALQWTEEVAAIGMVWAVYMGASLCVRERFHIRIMAGVLLLPRPMAKGVVMIADLLTAIYCGLMLIICVDYLGTLAKYPQLTPSLRINELYPQSILVIGHALILMRLVQVYVTWQRDGRHGIPGMRSEHQVDEKMETRP